MRIHEAFIKQHDNAVSFRHASRATSLSEGGYMATQNFLISQEFIYAV